MDFVYRPILEHQVSTGFCQGCPISRRSGCELHRATSFQVYRKARPDAIVTNTIFPMKQYLLMAKKRQQTTLSVFFDRMTPWSSLASTDFVQQVFSLPQIRTAKRFRLPYHRFMDRFALLTIFIISSTLPPLISIVWCNAFQFFFFVGYFLSFFDNNSTTF